MAKASLTVEQIAQDDATLRSVYEEVMWLAKRSELGVTEGMARAWYFHRARPLVTRIRFFSGRISEAAAAAPEGAGLVLEHELRIAASISDLIKAHLKQESPEPDEFVRLVRRCEVVNITTQAENASARKAKGNYMEAGIHTVAWGTLPLTRRAYLWEKVLKDKVANAREFKPELLASRVAERAPATRRRRKADAGLEAALS